MPLGGAGCCYGCADVELAFAVCVCVWAAEHLPPEMGSVYEGTADSVSESKRGYRLSVKGDWCCVGSGHVDRPT